MPISFERVRAKLMVRLKSLDSAFERQTITPYITRNVDRFAFQEGLISALWQSWAEFCRETVIGATTGGTTTGGLAVSSPSYGANNELQVAYIATVLANGQNVNAIKASKGRHTEPNWGDVDKLILIVSGLAPSNAATLHSAFGGALKMKDLQVCRNANAHVCAETIALIQAARVRYSQTSFRHPSDVMHWVDPATNDYLWRSWIDEIDLVSQLAVQ